VAGLPTCGQQERVLIVQKDKRQRFCPEGFIL
jgi:hypothetical protein